MKLCLRCKCTLFQSLNAEASRQYIRKVSEVGGENIKIQSVFTINNKLKKAQMEEHYEICEVEFINYCWKTGMYTKM